MEKVKYTVVYLRSGRTAIVGGTESHCSDGVLYVYPEDGPEVTFNWANVEFYRVAETELPALEQPQPPAVKDLDAPVDTGYGGLYL